MRKGFDMEDIIMEEYTKDKSRGDKRKLKFRHKLKKLKLYKADKKSDEKNPEKKENSKLSISDKKKLISCYQELENAKS